MPSLRIYKELVQGSAERSLDIFTGEINLTDWNTVSTSDSTVVEKFRVVTNAAETERLLDILIEEDFAMEGAADFIDDNTEPNPYWIEVEIIEGKSQRALLHGGTYTRTEGNGVYVLLDGEEGRSILNLTVTRGIWESSEPRAVVSANFGTDSNMLMIPNEGTLTGRINKLSVQAQRFVTDVADRVWAGVLPLRDGQTSSDFVSLWDATLGGGTQHVVNIDDNSVAFGHYSAIRMNLGDSSSSNTLFWRHSLLMNQVYSGSNDWHFAEQFNVLLRLKVAGTGAKMRVQVRSGVGNNRTVLGEIWLDENDSEWQLYELKGMHIPGYSYRRESLMSFKQFGIHLYVQDLTGEFNASHELHYNYARLIPAKHFVHLSGSNLVLWSHNENRVHCVTHEDSEVAAIAEQVGAGATDRAEITESNWLLPRHGGQLVIETTQNDMHRIDKSMIVTVQTTDRWRGLRN